MAHVKVIADWPRKRRLIAIGFVGMLLMLVNYFGRDVLNYEQSTSTYTTTIYPIGRWVTFLIVVPAILSWLAMSEQRLSRAALEAVVLTLGLMIPMMIWAKFDIGVPLRASAIFILATTLVYISVRLALFWFVRTFIREIVIQRGSLCWTCGYDLKSNTSGVCPECGTAVGSPAPTAPIP